MELIKQIKDTEKQAKEIVENARAEAVKLADSAKHNRETLIQSAQKKRIAAVADAAAAAEQKAKSEVEALLAEGQKLRQAMEQACTGKAAGIVEKVLLKFSTIIETPKAAFFFLRNMEFRVLEFSILIQALWLGFVIVIFE